jgi:hypothetical protein
MTINQPEQGLVRVLIAMPKPALLCFDALMWLVAAGKP